MNIEWNKVTWYSKLAAMIVFLGTFALAFWLGARYSDFNQNQEPLVENQKNIDAMQAPATMTDVEIKEKHKAEQKASMDALIQGFDGSAVLINKKDYDLAISGHKDSLLDLSKMYFDVYAGCTGDWSTGTCYITLEQKILADLDVTYISRKGNCLSFVAGSKEKEFCDISDDDPDGKKNESYRVFGKYLNFPLMRKFAYEYSEFILIDPETLQEYSTLGKLSIAPNEERIITTGSYYADFELFVFDKNTNTHEKEVHVAEDKTAPITLGALYWVTNDVFVFEVEDSLSTGDTYYIKVDLTDVTLE